MKIIGTTKDGYLLQAHREEIAKVLGFDWEGSSGCPKIESGMELDLSGIYNKADNLRSAKTKLAHIRKDLLNFAEELRPVEILIQAAEGVKE